MSVANLVRDLDIQVEGFIFKDKSNNQVDGVRVYSLAQIQDIQSKILCAIAVGDNYSRYIIKNEIQKLIGDQVTYPTLVHPTAYIAKNSEVAEGAIIFPGCIVGSNVKIGAFSNLNTRSSIDHDSESQEFSSMAPGSVTGGNVKIGCRSAVLIGAIISNQVQIGDDTVIAGGSTLLSSTGNAELWAGGPARLIRNRQPDEKYY
jgi:sugar O-acyltransferase (sialic acid O-acetyltransferase NeuD family)